MSSQFIEQTVAFQLKYIFSWHAVIAIKGNMLRSLTWTPQNHPEVDVMPGVSAAH